MVTVPVVIGEVGLGPARLHTGWMEVRAPQEFYISGTGTTDAPDIPTISLIVWHVKDGGRACYLRMSLLK